MRDLIHSGSFVVLGIELNLDTCAENLDSNYIMDSSLLLRVFNKF